jgi:hypothetical protein
MSSTREVLQQLEAIGATIEPAGDHLVLRAGAKAVPASVIRRLREAKPELLAVLTKKSALVLAVAPNFARVLVPADGEPAAEQRCAVRRGKVQELDGAFLHFCVECGRFAAFGYGVHLRAWRLGRWYCGLHRPHRKDLNPKEVLMSQVERENRIK